MTKHFFTLTFLFISFVTLGQDWITMPVPRSGILGAPVDKIKNGDPNLNFALKYEKRPAIDTAESAESIEEYEEQFRNFVTKYFNREKVTIATSKAYNLKIRSLSQETIDKLQVGAKYVYEGLAADSVEFTLSAKKEFKADISKAVKDIAGQITGQQATDIVEKITPFLDSISYEKNDSVFYRVKVKNPNVYYKIKVVQLKKVGNLCNCDWELRCFLYFVDRENNDFPRTFRLENDFTGERSRTQLRYPEFCGKDRKDVQYRLKVEKDPTTGLHLWIYQTTADVNNPEVAIKEVPFSDAKGAGKREFRLNRTLLYRFYERKIIKRVFIEVSARQVDENTVEVINWREGTNSLGNNALTRLIYPEFKGKYVKK